MKKNRQASLHHDAHAFDVRQRRRQDLAAVKAAVDAAYAADVQRFFEALESIELRGVWPAFMKAISGGPCPEKFRHYFLGTYISSGDHIRLEVGDDLILINGLRSLLPPYTGPAMTLYRGEGALNRTRRTYGPGWTPSKQVARAYACCGLYRSTKGGSVLLQAFAPAAAIICAPGLIDDRYEEQEYVVDRRRLTDVRVIERFSQVKP
jgi:hypothetical protein